MDPLSITASSIAILGALTSTSKGIGKLVSLRKAPAELQALSNEVEAFRSLLVIVQSSIRQAQESETYQEYVEALFQMLDDAQKAALELQSKVEYQLKRGVEVDKNGFPKVSRASWLKSAKDIEQLRAKIRDARSNLAVGLQALSLHISEATRQTTVQLQFISSTGPRPLNTSCDGTRSPIQPTHDEPRLLSSFTDETTLDSIRQATTPDTSAVRITTSVTTDQCSKLCKCQCHFRTQIRTPSWLKATLGNLLLSYHSLIRTTPCDYPPCRQSPRKTEFTYYFPQWFAQRALMISLIPALDKSGASLALTTPVIISDDSTILQAARYGNLPYLKQLFTQGYSPHVVSTTYGYSLVEIAVEFDQAETTKFLIHQGAKSDWRNAVGQTPAVRALLTTRQNILSDYGWDPEDVAIDLEFSSLHSAVAILSLSREHLEGLLEQQYRHADDTDTLGMTPLHWAAQRGNSVAVEILIQWGASVQTRECQGYTPLHFACVSGNFTCIKALLDAGADVNAKDWDGESPLMTASLTIPILDLMIERGADIQYADPKGNTMLHWSGISGESYEIINQFVTYGADINAQNNNGLTPVDKALVSNNVDCVSAFLNSSKAHGVSL